MNDESANPKQTQSDLAQFWESISFSFDLDWRKQGTVRILSPRQSRGYELALLGFDEFQYVFKKIEDGIVFYPVPKSLFEKHLLLWDNFGLLNVSTLEEKYKNLLQPDWMDRPPQWEILIEELRALIAKKVVSKRFAELWALYIRKRDIFLFIEEARPYDAAEKTLEGNKTRLVAKYIYALWMKSCGYTGGRNKTEFGNQLCTKVNDLVKGRIPVRRYAHYKSLLSVDGGLTRTVMDMTLDEITEYVEDGFLTKANFPEIFSAT